MLFPLYTTSSILHYVSDVCSKLAPTHSGVIPDWWLRLRCLWIRKTDGQELLRSTCAVFGTNYAVASLTKYHGTKDFLEFPADASGVKCALDDSFDQLGCAWVLCEERAILQPLLYMIYLLQARKAIVNVAVVLDEWMIAWFEQTNIFSG